MGTNYYYHEKERCPQCNRPYDALHIGKSSAGWCFSLHVIPDENLNDLSDWIDRWKTTNGVIVDEYGDGVSVGEMLTIIKKRKWKIGELDMDWYEENNAMPGPNGLSRHHIGPYCVGHGKGTWDLIPGDFS